MATIIAVNTKQALQENMDTESLGVNRLMPFDRAAVPMIQKHSALRLVPTCKGHTNRFVADIHAPSMKSRLQIRMIPPGLLARDKRACLHANQIDDIKSAFFGCVKGTPHLKDVWNCRKGCGTLAVWSRSSNSQFGDWLFRRKCMAYFSFGALSANLSWARLLESNKPLISICAVHASWSRSKYSSDVRKLVRWAVSKFKYETSPA